MEQKSANSEGDAWATRAPELARWALDRFFVRTDRHGGYEVEGDEVVKKTFPKAGAREGAVSPSRLERHFRALVPGDIIGAHTLAPGTSAGKWCALDLDNHGDDAKLPEANRLFAEARHEMLTHFGFKPLVLDYGRGSFHVVILFDRTLPGAVLKRFAEWVRGDKPQHEVFPKQEEVPADGYGNWLRLVGRHHTRDVWAKVYDGANWLCGADAVAHALALSGDVPDLIPENVRFPPAAEAAPERPEPVASAPRPSTGGGMPYRESVFAAYNRAATLADMIEHCEAAGHKLLSRSSDRATFTRAGKKGGESFNLKAMNGTVFCYNFSSTADIPENEGLNPVHTRCALWFGEINTRTLAQTAIRLEQELGIPPRQQKSGTANKAAPDRGAPQTESQPAPVQHAVERFADIEPALDARDFVEGLLTEEATSVLFGDSNTGKTFFALDLALHVATGEPWREREVERGGVVYFALEGAFGIRNRVSAYKRANNCNASNAAFSLVVGALDLRGTSADALRAVETVKAEAVALGVPVKLVIVDTLARAMAGGNENSPEDMGALLANAGLIQRGTNAHVMFIHHSGKDAARGARGHSSLRAAVDTEIELTRDEAACLSTARVTKQKDLRKGDAFSFRLQVVELGTDRRGKPVTSCVVREADAPTFEVKLNADSQAALALLTVLIEKQGQHQFAGIPPDKPSVPETWWRERFYAKKAGKPDANQKAFRRAVNELTKLNLVGIYEERAWLKE